MKDKKTLGLVTSFRKKQNGKDRICLHNNCEKNAINSHLLQKNGIINNIALDGHVIELGDTDFFKEENKVSQHKKIGINQAFSLKLFCNEHDTELFKSIEQSEINFYNYRTSLLLSYRALCAEIRKKEINIEFFNWVLNQHNLNIDTEFINIFLQGTVIGKRDLEFFKTHLECEILSHQISLPKFKFEVFEYSYIPVCASAIITFENQCNLSINVDPFAITPVTFISVVPYKNKTTIICGYSINHTDNNLHAFIESWRNLTDVEFQISMTKLLAGHIETWCMSPSYFAKIPKNIKANFLNNWDSNIMNFAHEKSVNFNLFCY